MKIKPLGERVLVKMVEAEAKTAGGILIPQTAQEKTQEGIVKTGETRLITCLKADSCSLAIFRGCGWPIIQRTQHFSTLDGHNE